MVLRIDLCGSESETDLGGRAGAEAGVAPRPPEAEASPGHLPGGSRSPSAAAAGPAFVRPGLGAIV